MTKKNILISLISFILFSYSLYGQQYTWRTRACLPAAGRTGVANFAIGTKAYVVCGFTLSSYAINEVWEYDETTNTWTQKNDYGGVAVEVPTSFVIDTVAYVGLGSDANGNFYTTFYKYKQSTDQWIPVSPFPGEARYTAMSFVINGKAYVGCGKGLNGPMNDFYEYDPVADSWTPIAPLPGIVRQTGIGISINGYGYSGLGYSNGVALDDMYKYDPVSNTWSQLNNFPGGSIYSLSTFVIDSLWYTAAGRTNNNYFTECWAYHPGSDTWVQQEDFSCLAPGRATWNGFAINGHGYVTCGSDGVNDLNDLLEFGPDDTAFTGRVHILGNDTSYCGNFNKILATGNPCTLWSTGVTASQITVSVFGTYWARIPDSCGMVSDSITIAQNPGPSVNLGNDTTSCSHQAITLNATTAGASYTWQDGSSLPTYTVTNSGTYSVTVTVGGCSASDSVHINFGLPPVTIASNADTICPSDSAMICAPAGYASYAWNVGTANRCINVKYAGNYYVSVTDNSGCSVESNHLSIIVRQAPPVSISGTGDTMRVYDATNIQWYLNSSPINGATQDVYIAQTLGSYTVSVTDSNGCTTFSSPVVFTGIAGIGYDENIFIYPNPLSVGNWQLAVGNDLLGSEIEIFDDNGRVVYKAKITSTHSEINAPPTCGGGIYLLRITTGAGVVVRKLVKL